VLLTHQLHLPGVPVFFQSLIDAFLYQLIKDFDEIWIPDEAQGICLSGKLSHPALKKIKCRYIGLLSRFEKYIPMEKEYDVLVILSGPEPHRSILEEKIFMQLNARSDWKCAMVIGSSKALQLEPARHITIFPLADGQTLKKLIEVSELIVCRSGYSSLMDLQHSNKKLLLIPTPGQAEQQYLAAHFSKYHQVVVQKQSNIDIQQGILQSKNDSMMKIPVNTRFKQVVQEWLNT
jgi:UDP-N-acetylglucosamine transferase subunit ALG13